ncbi:HIRAN domain-containing protein [Alkalibacillus silvisoli]|uniref:HIRAN domain-containing protein n=1 Tax=Alkalibacillus silvisoli TaxID=392823 RepID=A0ABN0ZQG0_9BACI
MNKHAYELWLIWQNPQTRQRYHIGRLLHDSDSYSFRYENSGYRRKLKEAMENGYKPHLAFPDINKTYSSNKLFGPFARRLPDNKRPDFHSILQDLGLPTDYTNMDLLRATGGRLATDTYEFVAPIFTSNSHFDFDFYIAGWRHYDGDQIIHNIQPGEQVRFELDPDNEQDSKAVIVLSDKYGKKLGYIPAFYSGFMYEVIKNSSTYNANIATVNPKAVPQLKVNIAVVGKFSKDLNKMDFKKDYEIQLLR